MTRHRWSMTIAMMALAATTALAGQTTTGATAQTTKPASPKVTFNENDKKATSTWFASQKQNPPPGLRSGDRLPQALESQMKTGFLLTDVLKGEVHPVPTDLLHMLAPPPGVYKYAIVDWHLVLIDESFRVFDVIHIEKIR
jgi:hypothetical protein